MLRYFIGFIATVTLIILLIVLIFHGGGKPKTQTTTKSLPSYSTTDAEVSLTIEGPIVADQNYRSIIITVSNNEAVYEQTQGYQGSVQNQQSYPNNVDAYNNFLYAIARAGFTLGDNSADLKNDLGYCPTGNRFIFQLTQDNQTLQRYWTTSCSGTPASFKGDANLIINLFQAQIPGYNTLSQGVNI